jgi:hypothetical protein
MEAQLRLIEPAPARIFGPATLICLHRTKLGASAYTRNEHHVCAHRPGHHGAVELGPLRRHALVPTRNSDEAEVLVQVALANTSAGVSVWRPSGDLRRWLLAIIHNAHITRRRRQQAERVAIGQTVWLTTSITLAAQPMRIKDPRLKGRVLGR